MKLNKATVLPVAAATLLLCACGSQTTAKPATNPQSAGPSSSRSATHSPTPVVSIGHPAQFRVTTADNGWELSWTLNSVRTATKNPIPADEGGGYLDGPGAGNVFLILQMTVRNIGVNTTNDPIMLGNWQ